jgi:hypothetical protein
MVAYAALVVESFDHEDTTSLASKYPGSSYPSGVASIVGGRNGGSALQCGTNNSFIASLDPSGASANYTKIVAGFAAYMNLAVTGQIFQLRNGLAGAMDFNIKATTGGLLQVCRAGTVIATGTTVLSATTFYYIEVKVLLATTAVGSYEVRINGVTEAALTASSVQTSGAATASAWGLNGAGTTSRFDDLVIQDWSVAGVDFLGDVRIDASHTNAAGNYSQFGALSGTNESNVDEAVADGDTSFNSDATVSDKDSFVHDVFPTNGTPYIVQVTTQARKDDAGARSGRNFLRISGTDYEGATYALGTGYAMYRDIWNSDPSGGAWVQANVEAAEIGYKVQA